MTKLLVLLVAVGCSKSDDKKPAGAAPPALAPAPATAPAGGDPWGAGSSGASADPWTASPGASLPETAKPASPEAAAAPSPRPQPSSATGAASALAGTYHCSELSSGSRSGRYQTDYVPSAMGTFQIAENGAYSSASFPGKGSGRVSADAGTVTFDGGPYSGFIGLVGSVSTGATIRFGGVQTQPPTPSVHFHDHVCYRK